MSTVYVLVGVPGSGKSTWIKNQDWALGLSVVSTDSFVEAYAAEQGKTYAEVFEAYMPTAVRLMVEQVEFCKANGQDIIWDQTSTTVATRKKKFAMLPDYYTIAVVFRTPEPAELERRLAARPDKSIPWNVMQGMVSGFRMPTLEEGFDEVWHVN